ncbi:hypothetical protein LMG8286_00894 [Campylobacter suis]|uniref:Molybdate transport repressor n=1 Tax=Campylobacter suis TaxID=2790657 RepID=A0ABM8Q386_9BACT|nr:hypothetical protein LMG8286_00894 [Campylobacter suis]
MILFGVAYIGRKYYDMGASTVFTMFVATVCLVVCIIKLYQINFILIESDGFVITKGKKSLKINFKDIDDVGIKAIGQKQKAEVLMINFKKNKLNIQQVYGFAQPLGENKLIIFDRYELSKDKICEILKKKLKEYKKI